MSRKSKISLITIVLVLALAPVAFAGLSAVSPTFHPPIISNGFPYYYTDTLGITVDLPIPPAGDGVNVPTMIYAPNPIGQTNEVALRAGSDTEAFFFMARSPKAFQTKDGKAVVTFGLEASYVNGIPTDGQQMVFARIRIKAAVKTAGTYTFFHPWGSEVITVTQADITGTNKGIFYTKDVALTSGWVTNNAGGWNPVGTPSGFYGVLQADNTMSTFLRQVNPAPLTGWIGDGVNEATFTGSPTGYNKIRLQAPAGVDLDGRKNNFIEANTMVISGHIPVNTTTPLPLSLDRVTCSFQKSVEHIDVFLTSQQGAAVTITDAATNVLLYSGTVTSPTGKFFADFAGSAASVNVTVSAPGFGTTLATAKVIDYVNITGLVYDLATNVLTISATSSDWFKNPITPPTLTAVGFGNLTFNTLGTASLVVPLTAPLPPTVTVTSSVGGSDNAPVGFVK
jgi:hypothetical protein